MNKTDYEGMITYPVRWAPAKDLFVDLPKYLKKTYLGVCGKTNRVFKIAYEKRFWEMLIVTDLYASDEKCEEGRRCLNTHCGLNKTSGATMLESIGHLTEKNLKKMKVKDFPHNFDGMTEHVIKFEGEAK